MGSFRLNHRSQTGHLQAPGRHPAAGPRAALRTPTDIFPDIRIPVIGVVWNYTGLPPDQMSGRIITPFQRALTTTVNDIEHIVA